MKKIILILLSMFLSMNFINNASGTSGRIVVTETSDIESVMKTYFDSHKKVEVSSLLKRLIQHESNGNYAIVNSIGCMGLYQFKESTLKWLGYDVSLEEFKKNPDCFPVWMQHEAAKKFTNINKRILKNVIDEQCGKYVNGTLITESGILAAAHLAGPGGVKKYFSESKNLKDGYGTSIEDMLQRFQSVW